ncbi:NUDIX hydrolase [Siccirubricoccus sp. G192]|uniref:NUDIX hydrolase n=1 Tax=Siccirubricoccus sp. G192 TaxID=2849651 RepID=UPI001C2C219E|nr:NUDIX hydrolase [Siccirubricoccus sp. G192]MBV1799723.1 NUDIX hydrolase [Siccirubricoccus sp. G192]
MTRPGGAVLEFRSGGAVPAALHGVAFAPWPPPDDWSLAAGALPLGEPPLVPAPGRDPAAGAAILEPDGRVWIIDPAKGFGGYAHTFPKGRIEPGLDPQRAAMKECFEETGLGIAITGWLGDFDRSTTTTRLYLARRLGGSPVAFDPREVEAVRLVPVVDLPAWLTNAHDAKPVAALLQHIATTGF